MVQATSQEWSISQIEISFIKVYLYPWVARPTTTTLTSTRALQPDDARTTTTILASPPTHGYIAVLELPKFAQQEAL